MGRLLFISYKILEKKHLKKKYANAIPRGSLFAIRFLSVFRERAKTLVFMRRLLKNGDFSLCTRNCSSNSSVLRSSC